MTSTDTRDRWADRFPANDDGAPARRTHKQRQLQVQVNRKAAR
jgi:hypothetical protein